MPRQAMLLIADEIYFNLYGKAILQGIYNTDLVIPTNPSTAPQLLFYFIIETDITEPFHSLSVEIALPEMPPVRNMILIPPPELFAAQARAQSDRKQITVKHPMIIQGPSLRPGRIEAKVVHESGEIIVTAQWIILNPGIQTAKAN